MAAILDYLAIVGIWVALTLVVLLAAQKAFGPLESSIYCFAFAIIWLGKADVWAGAYEFGRTTSPLLILLGLVGIRRRQWWYLLPLAFVLPRIFLQLEPQVKGIILAILG
jgi:hypothetical protein